MKNKLKKLVSSIIGITAIIIIVSSGVTTNSDTPGPLGDNTEENIQIERYI